MAVYTNPGLVAPTTEEQIAYFDTPHFDISAYIFELPLLGIFGHAPTGRGTIFISRSKFLSYRGGLARRASERGFSVQQTLPRFVNFSLFLFYG